MISDGTDGLDMMYWDGKDGMEQDIRNNTDGLDGKDGIEQDIRGWDGWIGQDGVGWKWWSGTGHKGRDRWIGQDWKE